MGRNTQLNVTYQNTYYFCQHFDELKKWGTSLRSWGNQLDFEGKYLPLEIGESNGRHGLKCKQAAGQKTRHIEVNKWIIHLRK